MIVGFSGNAETMPSQTQLRKPVRKGPPRRSRGTPSPTMETAAAMIEELEAS